MSSGQSPPVLIDNRPGTDGRSQGIPASDRGTALLLLRRLFDEIDKGLAPNGAIADDTLATLVGQVAATRIKFSELRLPSLQMDVPPDAREKFAQWLYAAAIAGPERRQTLITLLRNAPLFDSSIGVGPPLKSGLMEPNWLMAAIAAQRRNPEADGVGLDLRTGAAGGSAAGRGRGGSSGPGGRAARTRSCTPRSSRAMRPTPSTCWPP